MIISKEKLKMIQDGKRPRNYEDYCKALAGKKYEPIVNRPRSVSITREDLANAWDKNPSAIPSKISSEFARLCENLKLD